MIFTSLNASSTLSDQMGSPFPLMWLSSQQTWWLGTRGATTPAFTCAEPTSRRPENLLLLLLSFMCLVNSFSSKNCHLFHLLNLNTCFLSTCHHLQFILQKVLYTNYNHPIVKWCYYVELSAYQSWSPVMVISHIIQCEKVKYAERGK